MLNHKKVDNKNSSLKYDYIGPNRRFKTLYYIQGIITIYACLMSVLIYKEMK